MKIAEAVKKAKGKAKAKVAAKTGKALKKAAKTACVLAALALGLAGCIEPTDPAAYSNTQNIEKCIVVIAQRATVTEDKVCAEGEVPVAASYDIFSQVQNLENSGTQAADQKSTPTMTIDTDAAFDIPVNKANSGTSAATGALEKLAGAGADWVSAKVGGGGGASTATTAAGAATTAGASCSGGSCSDCADCSDE